MAFSWNRCIICQKTTKEELRCPLRAKGDRADPKLVYGSFIQNVSEFNALNALPVPPFPPLDIDANNFFEKEASWHKSRHLLFSTSKFNKAKERLSRKPKKEQSLPDDDEAPAYKTRRLSSYSKDDCILCGQGGHMREVPTFATDEKLRRMITELQDSKLLRRICEVDLVTTDAKYRLKRMTDLRNRYRHHTSRKRQESCEMDEERIKESQAFIKLIEYIETSVENDKLMFLLSELHSLYVRRLETLDVQKNVNKTRLKTSLLENFPDAQEQNDDRNVVIIFAKTIQSMVKEAMQQRDFSEDVVILAKASAIVRKDIFSHKRFQFSGNFTEYCQECSVYASLKSLVSMILTGINIENTEVQESQACLTVCQTIFFNAKERSTTKSKTGQTRHTKSREPPLPLYIGFNVHALTRSKTLIAQLYQMGISVSYQGIIELENMLATSISERFEMDGCVVPACLRKGIFIIAALDNIDQSIFYDGSFFVSWHRY